MTSGNLSQSGQAVDLEKYTIGHKAYFYKPPSMNETIARGRRAKHIDHYVGPGIIIKHIGTRSIVIKLATRAGTAGYCYYRSSTVTFTGIL
jgi:hypothetical protein